jgi:hypothetical protein
MDTYGATIGGAALPQQVRKSTHADNVREEAERLTARLSSIRGGLQNLRDRIAGTRPENAEGDSREVMNSGGFIGSVGTAILRAHVEVTQMENLLAELSEVI